MKRKGETGREGAWGPTAAQGLVPRAWEGPLRRMTKETAWQHRGDGMGTPREDTTTWPVHKVPRTGSPQTESHRQDCAAPPGGCSPGPSVPPIPPPGPPAAPAAALEPLGQHLLKLHKPGIRPRQRGLCFPNGTSCGCWQRPQSRPKRNRQTPTQRKAKPHRAR